MVCSREVRCGITSLPKGTLISVKRDRYAGDVGICRISNMFIHIHKHDLCLWLGTMNYHTVPGSAQNIRGLKNLQGYFVLLCKTCQILQIDPDAFEQV